MRYPIIIECDRSKKRECKRFLRKYRLYWSCNQYSGVVSSWDYEKIYEFCRHHSLKIKVCNEFGERSTTYRYTFFRNNPPHFNNRYFCAYCGRLIKKEKITVDHIYPVAMAKRSIALQKKLKRMGMKNINDKRNLVAACKRCNSRKSAKMDGWIIRGKIGRYPSLWVVRHLLRLTVIIYGIYFFNTEHFQLTAVQLFRVFETGIKGFLYG